MLSRLSQLTLLVVVTYNFGLILLYYWVIYYGLVLLNVKYGTLLLRHHCLTVRHWAASQEP